jgi:hypothetical protein
MHFLSLFAQNKPTGSPFERPEIIWGSAALAAALLVGAAVIYFVDKWRRQAAMTDREASLELTDYRAMLESGEITEAEYNKLRLKVADRVKHAVATAPAGAGPAAPPHPPFAGPFPAGYFDDPTRSPPGNSSPPNPPGGTAPSA